MIPKTLSEWSVNVLLELLSANIYESEEFDLKKMLPYPKDEEGKIRLRAACCAFANSTGGFLVFGIDDDKSKEPSQRVIGLDATIDFPEHFGNFPKLCSPSVYWTFKNPPIKLDTGKVIQIVYIPPSSKVPHAYGDPEQGWKFSKRTNKGTEGMSIEEIRNQFLGFYEKRLRLQLLEAELATLQEVASSVNVSLTKNKTGYSLVSFSIQTIESIIADTYPLTANAPGLLSELSCLRQAIIIANNKIKMFFGVVSLPVTDNQNFILKHNEFMSTCCDEIVNIVKRAREHLKPLLMV